MQSEPSHPPSEARLNSRTYAGSGACTSVTRGLSHFQFISRYAPLYTVVPVHVYSIIYRLYEFWWARTRRPDSPACGRAEPVTVAAEGDTQDGRVGPAGAQCVRLLRHRVHLVGRSDAEELVGSQRVARAGMCPGTASTESLSL